MQGKYVKDKEKMGQMQLAWDYERRVVEERIRSGVVVGVGRISSFPIAFFRIIVAPGIFCLRALNEFSTWPEPQNFFHLMDPPQYRPS